MIFASTNKVYGRLMDRSQITRMNRRYVPNGDNALVEGISEIAPLDFYSPYGCSKGAADQYVRDYGRVFGLNTVVMRMSCIYGLPAARHRRPRMDRSFSFSATS